MTEQIILDAIADAWRNYKGNVETPFTVFRAGFIAGLEWLSKKKKRE